MVAPAIKNKTSVEGMKQEERIKQRQNPDRDRPQAQRTGAAPDDDRHYTSRTIPVIEESVEVDKRVVETGQVNISKRVSEEDVIVDVPYVKEEIQVERVPINRYIDTPPPAIRHDGDTTIIPVLREVVVKRLVLVEELHVTKKKIKHQASQDMTLRREEVEIKRSENPSSNQNKV
ncbi:YsnF/AvaK domain-containing protein [Cesiribacter andamanensis]|uniref:DUF2382 domain-containing protein n=1 Tax=Cesiribacter andamanensis AMV16 TaxID=1279009 RepID=M7N172_9BACT|nr:YsnF/AvaK domain-containing protein [Cesiribacter andamanensis]EMR00961.1 hypothetical protein ADICEAN_03920 [Cesiribacter andamanensis AMV16]